MRISDWSSDVCSSDLLRRRRARDQPLAAPLPHAARCVVAHAETERSAPMLDIQHLVGIAPLTLAGAAAMPFGAASLLGLTWLGLAILPVPFLGLSIPPGEAVVPGSFLPTLLGP